MLQIVEETVRAITPHVLGVDAVGELPGADLQASVDFLADWHEKGIPEFRVVSNLAFLTLNLYSLVRKARLETTRNSGIPFSCQSARKSTEACRSAPGNSPTASTPSTWGVIALTVSSTICSMVPLLCGHLSVSLAASTFSTSSTSFFYQCQSILRWRLSIDGTSGSQSRRRERRCRWPARLAGRLEKVGAVRTY